jgi:hypothetical protein
MIYKPRWVSVIAFGLVSQVKRLPARPRTIEGFVVVTPLSKLPQDLLSSLFALGHSMRKGSLSPGCRRYK